MKLRSKIFTGNQENYLTVNLFAFYPFSINKNDDISSNSNLSWVLRRGGYENVFKK